MNTLDNENLLRAAFAPARSLEPTDAEIGRVLSRASADAVRVSARRPGPGGATPRRWRVRSWRRLAPAVVTALALLVGGGYAAVPPVRAAIDDASGTFAGWLGGNGSDAPGRRLSAAEQAPAYFRDPRYTTDPRVIAEADGYKLYAARQAHGDGVEFDLGNTGVGLGEVSADAFRGHAVIVLGPGAMQNADEHGHVPLFGITARGVKSVELTYDSGPPLRVDDVDGGFVLLAQPQRDPREVIGLDATGRELGRRSVRGTEWKRYGPPSPRVPAECQPGAVGLDPPKECRGG
jgi:hypothetical protein